MSAELVELELGRYMWMSLREATGSAGGIPAALRAMMDAAVAADVERAYWRLENHVVVQGQLYESAVAVVSVLMAALAGDGLPRHVRIGVLELLFQIVAGEAHASEVARGQTDLGERCRRAAASGLWLLYREVVLGERDAALEVLRRVETDLKRLERVEQEYGRRDTSPPGE